jgi:hypothetical protein
MWRQHFCFVLQRSKVQISARKPAILTEVFAISPGECWDSTLKLDHDCLLPNPFQFIIHVSPLNSRLYSLSYWKKVFKQTDNNNNRLLNTLKRIQCGWWHVTTVSSLFCLSAHSRAVTSKLSQLPESLYTITPLAILLSSYFQTFYQYTTCTKM